MKLIDDQAELMRKLGELQADGWYPCDTPGFEVLWISPGWRVVRHGTGAYHYLDGQKRGDLRYRVNITIGLVDRLLLQCSRPLP